MALPIRKDTESLYVTPENLERVQLVLGYKANESTLDNLPFSLNDTTVGAENELQTVVGGRMPDVDLPQTIVQSNYYRNLLCRMRAGEMPLKIMEDLSHYLKEQQAQIWENSWVRFPRRVLCPFAEQVFSHDLCLNKKEPKTGRRTDVHRFIATTGGEEYLRLPVSYLLKLSLIDALGAKPDMHPLILACGSEIMNRFLNDNTSPEIASFQPVRLDGTTSPGSRLARETAKRFLLVQALLAYANIHFGLKESGQQAIIYSSPHPPVRQKRLNSIISDAFYRELFMNPCLSGWDKGQDKHAYMELCHQVLSRSQLNAVFKLKEAGIITNDLVILPSISTISLANNGTHISLGSQKLGRLLGDPQSDFFPADEKYLGDLTIKIVEHFLPLFVGTYSAAPYRLGFSDFHPERALGFLPHELDYTHLRMLWRRWRKKADLSILGRSMTPFGLRRLDEIMSMLFGLRGDFVPDFRLIDYLVCLMSTDESPALNGQPGNSERLKVDLESMGVFDRRMSLYLLYKLREHASQGFSGFEGRHYSLFASLLDDMGPACGLQSLITAVAYRYALTGQVKHAHIPDDPTIESERRQIFFGGAIGLPTFFVHKDSQNAFLLKILARTERTRPSHRYPGYIRVYNAEYRRALLDILEDDAADLIEAFGMSEILSDLRHRITFPDLHGAASSITHAILQTKNSMSPLDLSADEFNLAAEQYYRTTLRVRHLHEGLAVLEEDLREADRDTRQHMMLKAVFGQRHILDFLTSIRKDLPDERLDEEHAQILIQAILLTVLNEREKGYAAPVR